MTQVDRLCDQKAGLIYEEYLICAQSFYRDWGLIYSVIPWFGSIAALCVGFLPICCIIHCFRGKLCCRMLWFGVILFRSALIWSEIAASCFGSASACCVMHRLWRKMLRPASIMRQIAAFCTGFNICGPYMYNFGDPNLYVYWYSIFIYLYMHIHTHFY